MIQLIEATQLPETKTFRGRPNSKLRDLPEFQKALAAIQRQMIPQGKALEIVLTPESLAEAGDAKNLETRVMQILTNELKKRDPSFVVRKRTVEKGERPHLFLVRKNDLQTIETFEQTLQEAAATPKKLTAAA